MGHVTCLASMYNLYISADLDGDDLNDLVGVVTRRAQAIANQAYARRQKFQKSMTHPHSRSYGNLIELQEDEEEEVVRKNRLKFPSDYAIDSTYQEMLGNREDAMRTLRGLVRTSREVGEEVGMVRGRKKVAGENEELESSLSEPNLHRGMYVCVCVC